MKNIIRVLYMYLASTACFAFIIACFAFTELSKRHQSTKIDLAKDIIGEWRNVYVKITINHANKPPVTMEADSSNWEARLGIKPIRTHFMADWSYYSEYLNLRDGIIRDPRGTWMIKGGSLLISQQTPDKSNYKYLLKIENDHAIFSGMIDFDGEGVANDEYYGIQKKFGNR
jgi:hypothetical protein